MLMPHVRKLTTDEVHSVEQQSKCRRRLTTELYDSLLAEFSAGDYGEVAVKANENRTIVRNRLHAAAARRGLALRFLHARRRQLRFRVEPQPEAGVERLAISASDLSRQLSHVCSPGLPVAACGA
jgi:hypothetical protein